jgi:hypothetical protein
VIASGLLGPLGAHLKTLLNSPMEHSGKEQRVKILYRTEKKAMESHHPLLNALDAHIQRSSSASRTFNHLRGCRLNEFPVLTKGGLKACPIITGEMRKNGILQILEVPVLNRRRRFQQPESKFVQFCLRIQKFNQEAAESQPNKNET